MPGTLTGVGDSADMQRTRPFDIGATSFDVSAPSAAIRTRVEQMFTDLPTAPDSVHHFEIAEADDRFELTGPNNTLTLGNESIALATLATSVNRLALDADPGRLHLHCAALAHGEVAVLISAASGTGKSTLAAALAQTGWAYLSDEAVALHDGGATAFNKPILLKGEASEMLGLADDVGVALPDSRVIRAVPASHLGAPLASISTPNVVVVLHRQGDGSVADAPICQPLHPADAAVSLLQQSMDSVRYGPDALAHLVALTSAAHCVAVSVGPPAATAQLVASLTPAEQPMQSRPIAPIEVTPDAVRSHRVGDRVAVHDTSEGGAIAALDEAGSAAWLALHGQAPDWYPPHMLTEPATQPFLRRLETLGLLLADRPVEQP